MRGNEKQGGWGEVRRRRFTDKEESGGGAASLSSLPGSAADSTLKHFVSSPVRGNVCSLCVQWQWPGESLTSAHCPAGGCCQHLGLGHSFPGAVGQSQHGP